MALYPGLPKWAGTRRNIHPPHLSHSLFLSPIILFRPSLTMMQGLGSAVSSPVEHGGSSSQLSSEAEIANPKTQNPVQNFNFSIKIPQQLKATEDPCDWQCCEGFVLGINANAQSHRCIHTDIHANYKYTTGLQFIQHLSQLQTAINYHAIMTFL